MSPTGIEMCFRERLAKLEKDEREYNEDVDHWNRTRRNELPFARLDPSPQINELRSKLGLPPRGSVS